MRLQCAWRVEQGEEIRSQASKEFLVLVSSGWITTGYEDGDRLGSP